MGNANSSGISSNPGKTSLSASILAHSSPFFESRMNNLLNAKKKLSDAVGKVSQTITQTVVAKVSPLVSSPDKLQSPPSPDNAKASAILTSSNVKTTPLKADPTSHDVLESEFIHLDEAPTTSISATPTSQLIHNPSKPEIGPTNLVPEAGALSAVVSTSTSLPQDSSPRILTMQRLYPFYGVAPDKLSTEDLNRLLKDYEALADFHYLTSTQHSNS